MTLSDNARENMIKRVNARQIEPKTPSLYGMATIVVLPPETQEIPYRQQDGTIIYMPNLYL